MFLRLGLIACACGAALPGQTAKPYGPPIPLVDARRIAESAQAEARKNHWTMAVAVVDPGGNLVLCEMMDGTAVGSAEMCIQKARSAVLFKRPTKDFQDALAQGGVGLRVLRIQGAVPIDGGIPLLLDDRIVGAVGVSGDTPDHDGQCAKAGAASLGAATR